MGFFQFWHAGAPDHKQDLRGKRHPFLDFFHFWHAGAPDHKQDLRDKRHPFFDFFQFWHAGAPDHKPDLRGERHPFFGFFQFWHAGTPDHKQDLRGERHPFLDFFSFGMPGHLIISRIYVASGILFGIFSVLACRGTRSQIGFTRQAASFLGFFQFWHARAPDHKQDLRGKRHPFLTFFIFGMPGHPIISWIYAASGIPF